MHKKVNVLDITSRSPMPVLTGVTGPEFDHWFSTNHDVIYHWAVMSDSHALKEVVVLRTPGASFKK